MRRALLLLATLSATALASPRAASAEPPPDALLDRIERHAVLVVLRFQKDLQADAEGAFGVDPDSPAEIFRRWRMSMRVPGFVVRDRRTVVAADVYLPTGAIRAVEVEGRDGVPVPARLKGFLPRCGGIVVETERDLEAGPVEFPPEAAATPAEALFAGSIAEGSRGLEVWAEALGVARRRAYREPGATAFGRPARLTAGLGGAHLARTADLVARADGTAVGFRFGSSVDLDVSTWRGRDVLADLDAMAPFAALRDRAKALNEASRVYLVRIAFRPPSADPDSALSYGDGSPPPEPDPETRWWGIAIAPDRVLVPTWLPDAWVRRIGRATVEETGGPAWEASFEGRVRGVGAFVLRVPDAVLDALPAESAPFPPAEHAFLVHRVAWRAGARRDLVEYNRSLGRARGHGDASYETSEESVPSGAFLLDLEGRVLGVSADLRPEDPDRPAGRSLGADPPRGVVALVFADMGPPASLADDLDRRALPVGSKDARRRMWLGVEVEPITGAAVAEALGVSGPSRDGTRGLMVNVVYEGSPAARAGLQTDDLLLAAQRTDTAAKDAAPVDLRDAPSASEWPDVGEGPRPWAPRSNALVRLLEAWGEGARYRLEVFREGAVRSVAFTVEAAPRDTSNALEARDAEAGLGVKELTYEVRYALRLAADAPGVLVAEVGQGSPADQARFVANEVLVDLDGTPLQDPRHFLELLSAARARGAQTVRASLLRLDRSRFVDLRVRAPGAPPPTDR